MGKARKLFPNSTNWKEWSRILRGKTKLAIKDPSFIQGHSHIKIFQYNSIHNTNILLLHLLYNPPDIHLLQHSSIFQHLNIINTPIILILIHILLIQSSGKIAWKLMKSNRSMKNLCSLKRTLPNSYKTSKNNWNNWN